MYIYAPLRYGYYPYFRVLLVYKKKGLIKMEMNELQTLRHSASHMLAQAVKKDFIRIQNLLSVRLLMTVLL